MQKKLTAIRRCVVNELARSINEPDPSDTGVPMTEPGEPLPVNRQTGTAISAAASVVSRPAPLYPAQYKDDVERRNREEEMEEAGIKKPSQAQRLAAALVRAYDAGNTEGVISAEKAMEKITSKSARKRKNKKARSKAIGELRNYMDRSPDPPSGDERNFTT